MVRKLAFAVAVLLISAMCIMGGVFSRAAAQKSMTTPTEQKGEIVAGEAAAKQLLLLMDRDKDGRVSKKEWMTFMEEEFDRLDTNHDGYVNAKDLEKAQIQPVPFYRVGK